MPQPLLTPYRMGSLELPNRVVMAPMTRNRGDNAENEATDLVATYYAQRASAGLIISEGTFVSRQAVGFINVPGLYSDRQTEGWNKVTAAVHANGGRIFAQLWHVGAVSHPDLQVGGELPVAPSAVNPMTNAFTRNGFKPTTIPRALETKEIEGIVQDFGRAAARAAEAGFDGIELHAANGYLFHQFFARSMNHRGDQYGGPIENRARFLFEVIEAVKQSFAADRIGVRLNPAVHNLSGIMFDKETLPLFDHLIEVFNAAPLAYLHIMEPITDLAELPEELIEPSVAAYFRKRYRGTLIGAVDYTFDSANEALRRGDVDLVAFGRAYIANPDLVARFTAGALLASPSRDTFYSGGPKGYVDYPVLAETRQSAEAATLVAPGERYAETRVRSRVNAEH
jgi:N-ethylmaleimide reductase